MEKEAWRAIIRDSVEALRVVLDAGMSLNAKVGPDCESLFYCACEQGNLEIVNFLLERRQETLLESWGLSGLNCGKLAIYVVSYLGFYDIVKALIKHGSPFDCLQRMRLANISCQATPIFLACASRRVNIAELLLVNGANANSKLVVQGRIKYVLQQAAVLEDVEMVRLLLNHGANPLLESIYPDEGTPDQQTRKYNTIQCMDYFVGTKPGKNTEIRELIKANIKWREIGYFFSGWAPDNHSILEIRVRGAALWTIVCWELATEEKLGTVDKLPFESMFEGLVGAVVLAKRKGDKNKRKRVDKEKGERKRAKKRQ